MAEFKAENMHGSNSVVLLKLPSFPSVTRPNCTTVVDGGSTPTVSAATVSNCPSHPSRPSKSRVPACLYEADAGDLMDMQLSWHLQSLDRSLASALMVRRLGSGEYDFDGRRVRLVWSESGTKDGLQQLLVCEGSDTDTTLVETPLPAYLHQAADIAASLGGLKAGSPAVARVPADRRLTFANVPPRTSDDPTMERVRSMRVACEQARLREHAAEAYEQAERRERRPSNRKLFGAAPANIDGRQQSPPLPLPVTGCMQRPPHLTMGSQPQHAPSSPPQPSGPNMAPMSLQVGGCPPAAAMRGRSATPTPSSSQARQRSLPKTVGPSQSQCRHHVSTGSLPRAPMPVVVMDQRRQR